MTDEDREALARAVIDRAAGDFLMPIRRGPDRLYRAKCRMEAGMFLLERMDPVATLWFNLADVSLAARHRRYDRYQRRLARCVRVVDALTARGREAMRAAQKKRQHDLRIRSLLSIITPRYGTNHDRHHH